MAGGVSRIRAFLAPPVFPGDEDKTRMAGVLNTLLLALLFVILAGGVVMPLAFVGDLYNELFILGLFLAVVASYWLMRRGRVRRASTVLVCGLWIVFTVLLFLVGGMTSIVAVFYVAGTVIAGLLLGARAALIYAAACSLAGLGMVLLEASGQGLLHLLPVPPVVGWVDLVLSLGLTTTVLYLVLRSLNETLVLARRQVKERKRAEASLRESEVRYRSFVQNFQGIAFRGRMDFTPIFFHGAVEEMTGYTEGEFVAGTPRWDQIIHPEDLPGLFGEDEERLHSIPHYAYEREYRILHRNGAVRWIHEVIQNICDDSGEPVMVQGAIYDITERKRAEEALRRRTEQLEALRQVELEIASHLDLDALLRSIVARAADLLGAAIGGLYLYRPAEGKLEVVADVGLDPSLEGTTLAPGEGLAGKIWQGGEPVVVDDYKRWEGRASVFGNQDFRATVGVPVRWGDEFLGVLDVSADRPNVFGPADAELLSQFATQAAMAIQNARLFGEAKQRFRELTLLNRVIAATAVAGERPEPVLEAVCRELALAFEVPQAAAALFNEEKTEAVVVAEYLAEGRPAAVGERIPVADNPASQHLLSHKTPLVIGEAQSDPRQAPIHDLMRRRGTVSLLLVPLMVEGRVVGSLGLDAVESRTFSATEVNLAWRVAEQVSSVLARARLREERRQLEERFHQAQKMEAVGRLAGGVAHDFNNLLTIIHLSTQLLERKMHPEDPLWSHVQSIRDADRQATSLVRQLLAFSRREIVEPQALNLNRVLGELERMLRRIIGEDIKLTTRLGEGLWPVEIDPTQVEQMVVNLAVNARDAMPDGGKLSIETANVVLNAAYAAQHLDVVAGEYVLLTVGDTGMGMSEEVKAHVFEPFFTTKEKGKGTGLGLATVFGIVKQNRGHIGVESEEGQGTTFEIYLPRMVADHRVEPKGPRAYPELPVQGSETVLVVEDEAPVRDLVRDILAAQGYRVLTAGDGLEGLEVAQGHEGPIHLLLTDVVMPHLSGRALADQLRPMRPEMRVLFTSGYADDAIVQHGVLEEGVNFLAKPFELEALARKVRAMLDGEEGY